MPLTCRRGDCDRAVSLKQVSFETSDKPTTELYECSQGHRFTVQPLTEGQHV